MNLPERFIGSGSREELLFSGSSDEWQRGSPDAIMLLGGRSSKNEFPMSEQAETHRIETGGVGFGEADESLIEKRAADIARWDGRQKPNARDRDEALRELRSPTPPELTDVPVTLAELPGSGVPAVSSGTHTPARTPDDEETIADELVHEGLEEADRDQRDAAADEPEE